MINQSMIIDVVNNFSLQGFYNITEPLITFMIGITLYSLFIFKWYRFVAKEDVITFDIHRYRPGWKGFAGRIENVLFYGLKYLILFPAFLLFWFTILSVLLIFLTKSQTVEQILLISTSLIGSIRITAYYDEDLSKDLAKMMPFALLGVVLIDFSYFDSLNSASMLLELPSLWETVLHYLLLIVVIEFGLRIIRGILALVGISQKKKEIKDL